MKSVLISIQPKWCDLITCKKRVKTVEIRKTRPKIAVPFKCYIYQTKKPVAVSFSGTGKHISEYDKTYFYNDRSGRVIGEFVCDRIQKYECEFVDDDCYEEIASIFQDEDGDETGFIEWSNDSHIPYENTDLYEESRVTYKKLKKYMGMGFGTFYGWHISDLVIYEQPRELREFKKFCTDFYGGKHCEDCEYFIDGRGYEYDESDCGCDGLKPLTRPPQSWCYVEGKEDEGEMKDVCMRCEHGKGYFVGESIIFIGKDGSVSIDADGDIIDFPAKTIKFCPWCGKKLHPTEKGGVEE